MKSACRARHEKHHINEALPEHGMQPAQTHWLQKGSAGWSPSLRKGCVSAETLLNFGHLHVVFDSATRARTVFQVANYIFLIISVLFLLPLLSRGCCAFLFPGTGLFHLLCYSDGLLKHHQATIHRDEN